MYFLAEQCGFRGAHRRKPQEIAGGFQGSRIKNVSQLSQEFFHSDSGVFKIRVKTFILATEPLDSRRVSAGFLKGL